MHAQSHIACWSLCQAKECMAPAPELPRGMCTSFTVENVSSAASLLLLLLRARITFSPCSLGLHLQGTDSAPTAAPCPDTSNLGRCCQILDIKVWDITLSYAEDMKSRGHADSTDLTSTWMHLPLSPAFILRPSTTAQSREDNKIHRVWQVFQRFHFAPELTGLRSRASR